MSKSALGRAQAGDGEAFRELVEPYRQELQLHCYRILGSVAEAEEVLQETLLAAWRGLDRFEGRASVRTWLYRIATNRCINALRDGRRRPPEPWRPFDPPEPWRPFDPPEPTHRGEVTWLQPYPDTLLEQTADQEPGPEARYHTKEAVELAFITGLQLLPPRQAATVVLRDVLGFPAADVAEMLGTTETAIKGTLQRARASLGRRRAGMDDARRPLAGSRPERELTRRFADAFTAGDVDGVVALLTDDAWLAMPPAPHEYRGRAAIRAFLDASTRWRGARTMYMVPTRANTQPAFGCYLAEAGNRVGHPAGLVVLTLADDRIGAITRFLDNRVFGHFGLADTISVDHPGGILSSR